ncbi:MAG TPA: hypothetical protein VMT34_02600 [Aggregatilineales bacterium]|nr:hypothetical protein [Aggregatilineales bacterium]
MRYDYVATGVEEVSQSIGQVKQTLEDNFNTLLKFSAPLHSGEAWRGTGQTDFVQDLTVLQQRFSALDNALQSFLSALSVVRDQAEQTIQSCNGIVGNIDAGAV